MVSEEAVLDIKEALNECEMVLVGIGKEMDEKFGLMEQDELYGGLLLQAERLGESGPALQYLRCHYLQNRTDSLKIEAYNRLAAALAGKNYFLVSLCTDDVIFRSELDPARIVTPCGGYRALQCASENHEDGKELAADAGLIAGAMEEIGRCCGDLKKAALPVCETCKETLWFNQITTPGYLEEGYLPQWEKYTKWLSGTLHHKLCILEVGAGMEYPGVIRFPFEKVAFFNQKARFFRVHSQLYQIAAEIADRATGIQAEPADILRNL